MSAAFQPDADALYYLKLARGHHSGGCNIRGVGIQDLTVFGPEQATTWEAGAHTDWLARRLRVNVALFRTRIDDVLVATRTPTPSGVPGLAVLENGGEAEIFGGELDVAALMGHLKVSLAVGVTRGRFTRLDPYVQEINLDSHLVHTAPYSAALTVDFPVRLGAMLLDLHADYGWRDNVWFEYQRDTLARQRSFGLFNLMLATHVADEALRIALWARNLTNVRYLARVYDAGYHHSAIPGNPRTWGMTLDYRFGQRSRVRSSATAQPFTNLRIARVAMQFGERGVQQVGPDGVLIGRLLQPRKSLVQITKTGVGDCNAKGTVTVDASGNQTVQNDLRLATLATACKRKGQECRCRNGLVHLRPAELIDGLLPLPQAQEA